MLLMIYVGVRGSASIAIYFTGVSVLCARKVCFLLSHAIGICTDDELCSSARHKGCL